jgi:hypothetical protein
MKYRVLQIFENYLDAHIVKGHLEAEGITCWLQDEHLSSIVLDPVLTNMVKGIKLIVPEEQAERAIEILNEQVDRQ